MTYHYVVFEQRDAIAYIELNRPQKLNSLSEQVVHELLDVFNCIKADRSVRAVLLFARGKAFSAGFDMGVDAEGSDAIPTDVDAILERAVNPLMRAIRSLDRPVVCAVNGVAIGAGAALALSCDIVLAARSASFVQLFSKVGLGMDAGSSYLLPRLIGEARAKGLALLAKPLRAEQAERWGLIWGCVDDDQLLSDATELVTHLAASATQALAVVKEELQVSLDNDFNTQLSLETRSAMALVHTADYREAVTAFREKRKPVFTGR